VLEFCNLGGNVAWERERSEACRVSCASLKKRDNLEDLRIDGEIILKWNLKKLHGRWYGLDSADTV
jgi:hypothetical protein